MAGNDIRDILNMNRPCASPAAGVSGDQRPTKKKKLEPTKRPTGMHREVFALLGSGNDQLDPPPLQKSHDKGLRHMKQLFGNRKVRLQ
jgi:hypothetical protein